MPGHQGSSRAIRAGCAVGRPPVRLETRHLDREHVEHDDRRIDKIPQVVNEKADALIAARRRFMLLQRDAVLTLARYIVTAASIASSGERFGSEAARAHAAVAILSLDQAVRVVGPS